MGAGDELSLLCQALGAAATGMVLTDPGLPHALWVTFLVMALSWLVQTPLSILIGVFLAGAAEPAGPTERARGKLPLFKHEYYDEIRAKLQGDRNV